MTWSSKRQLLYLALFIVLIGILGLLIIIPIINKPALCTDGKQNGDEVGIDCGGSCTVFCSSQVSDVVVLWSRAFHVAGDRYNILAYIENQNPAAEIKDINYEFRLYDAENKFIGLRDGHTSISPNGRAAIFEPGVNVGNKIPKTTLFKFTSTPVWLKADLSVQNRAVLEVVDKQLEQTDIAPRLTATIANNTIYNVQNIEFAAIIYDENDNAVAVSKTYLDAVPKNSKREIFFTWNEPLTGSVFKTEIIPKFDPTGVTF